MRLLRTGLRRAKHKTIEIIERWGSDIPPYAILSHLWSRTPSDEILFSDIENGLAHSKPACQKLRQVMKQARTDGHAYLWVDTCCIDKTSSAELSEAINSMYRYYANADKCYAYLEDVKSLDEGFEQSRWWRRGFCLQELLAPKDLEFFSATWESLGSKSSLHSMISRVTGIDANYLLHVKLIHHASIAQRMCWAAGRETAREEDIAYCLMGIFDVNMPLLYGEGRSRAFLRLQEEIMKINEDQTLFAWRDVARGSQYYLSGMLAESPEHFRDTGTVVPCSQLAAPEFTPLSLTPRGLRGTFPLLRNDDGTCVATLQCLPSVGASVSYLGIHLKRLSNTASQEYARIQSDRFATCSGMGQPASIYIRQNLAQKEHNIYPVHIFHIERMLDSISVFGYTLEDALWHTESAAHRRSSLNGTDCPEVPLSYKVDKRAGALTVALLLRREADGESFILMLGCREVAHPAFHVVEDLELAPFEELQSMFKPRPLSVSAKLARHVVQVKVHERVLDHQKIYDVDVDLARPPSSDDSRDGLVRAMRRLGLTAERGALRSITSDVRVSTASEGD